MQKNAEKYARHEALTNNFLVQLSYAIGCAIYTFFLMKNVAEIVIIRWVETISFGVFALLAAVLLFMWLKKGKASYKAGFCYSIIFSLMNLYLRYYHVLTKDLFGGYFYGFTMYPEFKTLLVVIGIGALACFAAYIIMDNMPAKKRK